MVQTSGDPREDARRLIVDSLLAKVRGVVDVRGPQFRISLADEILKFLALHRVPFEGGTREARFLLEALEEVVEFTKADIAERDVVFADLFLVLAEDIDRHFRAALGGADLASQQRLFGIDLAGAGLHPDQCEG